MASSSVILAAIRAAYAFRYRTHLIVSSIQDRPCIINVLQHWIVHVIAEREQKPQRVSGIFK